MTDMFIIIVLIIALVFGIKETTKHFKGEGACCGGASSKPKNKKLKNKIICRYTFHVDGMHCQNCANIVTRAINDIDGVAAKTYLNKKIVKVICSREIESEYIKEVIQKKGYKASVIK